MANEEAPQAGEGLVTVYEGREVDVVMDDRLCMAAGECNRAKGGLFVKGREPWCIPDQVSADQVSRIIERCPAGALTYRRKDGGSAEKPARRNTVVVANNGPLYAAGDLDIVGAPVDMPGVKCRAALCRCGKSRNKPFCDDLHEEAMFDDSGAVGEKGCGYDGEGGPLKIEPVPDGPLMANGKLTIISGSGREAWRGEQACLCRCGASKDKPFCDGSHVDTDFKSE